jgi:hypothetical protein
MAVLSNGILGNVRQKVGGVVGSQWKNRNTLRAYSKPANPNTVSQQAQRGKMSLAVAYIKPIVGTVLNVYADKFEREMSAFNRFIKNNIAKFVDPIDYSTMALFTGKIAPLTLEACIYDGGTDTATFNWSSDLGTNGSLTDFVMAIVYNKDNGQWYYASANVQRTLETIDVLVPGAVYSNLIGYIWLYRENAGTITMIGTAQAIQLTDAP